MTTPKIERLIYDLALPEPAEARAISGLRSENWRATYTKANQDWLEDEISQAPLDFYLGRIQMAFDPSSNVFMRVARQRSDGLILGYVVAWKDTVNSVSKHFYGRELRTLQVRSDFQGQGIGTSLWRAVLQEWVGKEDCYVEVAEGTKAVDYYKRRLGFGERIGTYQWGPRDKGVKMLALKRYGQETKEN